MTSTSEPDNTRKDLLVKFHDNTDEEKNAKRTRGAYRRYRNIFERARKNLQVILTVFGAVIGIATGLALRRSGLDPQQISYVHFPGELFLRMMKMFIIPITIASLISSSARIDTRTSGRIGLRIGLCFGFTLVFAALAGTVFSLLIRPGRNLNVNQKDRSPATSLTGNPILALMDLFRNMFAENLIEACLAKVKTIEVAYEEASENLRKLNSSTNATEVMTRGIEDFLTETVPGVNMIGLIVASLSCGCAISHVGDPALPLLHLSEAVFLVSLRIVNLFLWFTPIGVLSLVASNLAMLDEPEGAFRELSLFVVTFFAAAFCHIFIVLPGVFYVIVRKNPYRFIFGLSRALMTAFVTDSSAASIPVLIQTLECNNNIDSRVSRQIAALGATVSKNGGTLFFPIIPIFVAQTNGIDLNIGNIITINLVTISMVAGHAPTSGGGVIYIILLLTAVGLPTDGFGLILALDWLLERFRTTFNVLANGLVAGVVNHLSRDDLDADGRVDTTRTSINIENCPSQKDNIITVPSLHERRKSI